MVYRCELQRMRVVHQPFPSPSSSSPSCNNGFCRPSGYPRFSLCPPHRSSLRCLGTQVIPASVCVLHVCTHPNPPHQCNVSHSPSLMSDVITSVSEQWYHMPTWANFPRPHHSVGKCLSHGNKRSSLTAVILHAPSQQLCQVFV